MTTALSRPALRRALAAALLGAGMPAALLAQTAPAEPAAPPASASAPAAAPADAPAAAPAASATLAPSAQSAGPVGAGEPAAPAPADRLDVADPYLELHTGPGRGYPVFFTVRRGEWVRIEQRRTDWFQVRTAEGRLGWVPRAQLEKTLTAVGERKSFRDILLDDYLHRRVEAGGAWGRFKSEPAFKFWGTYRFSETLSAEAAFVQVQGVYSGSTLWHVNLNIEPWVDQRLSPFFGVGLGQFNNVPNRSLVENQETRARLGDATLGLRYYLTDRFVVRLEATLYTAFLSDTRSADYRAYTAGLSFFF